MNVITAIDQALYKVEENLPGARDVSLDSPVRRANTLLENAGVEAYAGDKVEVCIEVTKSSSGKLTAATTTATIVPKAGDES